MVIKFALIAAISMAIFACGYFAAAIDDKGKHEDECIGELLIGEEDNEDWPYLSLSLDTEVKNFEKAEYVTLKIKKLDLTQKKHGV